MPQGPNGVGSSGDAVRSVYVHAPFCARRCFYCDFAVTVAPYVDSARWLRALSAEYGLVEKEGLFVLADSLNSVFVGGGTPSLLGPEVMGGVAQVLGTHRLKNPELEWTAEANPESFTKELALRWGAAGVNRLSLGAQSFQAPALRWLGRLHGPEKPGQAVESARAAGIENVNLDLIFGLPREVERDWDRDLDSVLALKVPHVSLYGLTVEKGTPLAKAIHDGLVSLPNEEEYREQFLTASERLVAEGYVHYEVSNFALENFDSLHNRAYWESVPYLGLGSGAHSFRAPRRRWNLRDWQAYERACRDGKLPLEGEEEMGSVERRLEMIWLGLRTDRGIPLCGLRASGKRLVDQWVDEGLAVLADGSVRMTPSGWLLLDDLAIALDLAQGRSRTSERGTGTGPSGSPRRPTG